MNTRAVTADVIDSIISNSTFCLSGANCLSIEDFKIDDRRLFSRIIISRDYVPAKYTLDTQIGDITIRKEVYQRYDFLHPIDRNRLSVEVIKDAILTRLEDPKEVTSIDLAPHSHDPLWSICKDSWCSASVHLFHNPDVEIGERLLPNRTDLEDEQHSASYIAVENEYNIDLQKLEALGPGIALVFLNDIAAITSWRVFKTQEGFEGLRAAIAYSSMMGAVPDDFKIECQLKSLEGDVFYENNRRIDDKSIRMVEFVPSEEYAQEIGQASVRLLMGDILLDDYSGYVVRKINLNVTVE